MVKIDVLLVCVYVCLCVCLFVCFLPCVEKVFEVQMNLKISTKILHLSTAPYLLALVSGTDHTDRGNSLVLVGNDGIIKSYNSH